ncbi:MAG: hypothetical protein CBD21_03655 [bacterium TMED161]|nr:MAG: hypothetical protein CBD21_03655 [bacterium TMED161]
MHFLIFILSTTIAFSSSLANKPIELMIDPKSPDEDLVKIFQSKYMSMQNGDAGYGSFGPKTTKFWQDICNDDKTYEILYDNSLELKNDKKLKESNMMLDYLINFDKTPQNIIIKSKFLRAQIFYDLSYYVQAVNYFKLILKEDISSEYRKKALFMTAYIYNNNLNMYTDAINYYKTFLNEYKNDELISSVEYELGQINSIVAKIKD